MTSNDNTPAVELDSDEKKVSYGFGWQFGRQLHKNNFQGLDLDAVIMAVRQCFEGQPAALSDEDLNAAYTAIADKRKTAEQERADKMQTLNTRFLEENAQRDGVTVTDSGLQYEVLEAGDGDTPNSDDTVRTHYHGTFIDGQVFDSSLTRNEPAEFGVGQVIAGWTQALQLMQVGAKWRIVVPADLAYGATGSPPVIPPNTPLVFEIHLMAIV